MSKEDKKIQHGAAGLERGVLYQLSSRVRQ